MDPYNLPYNLRDALICLSFLVGAAVGIMAINRQHRTTGLLTLAGFLLLGIDPIAEVIIFRVIMSAYGGENFEVFNWAYVCISIPVIMLGAGCLIAAVFNATRMKGSDVDNSPIQLP